MHWFPEHCANHLSSSRPRLLSKVFSGQNIVVSIRPEIPHILKDNLNFPFPLLLVFLDPFILINTVHELMYTPYMLFGQRLSQIMLGRLADLESPYHHVIKVPIYLIEHLLVSV